MSAIGNAPTAKFNWDEEAFQKKMESKYTSTIDDNSPADGICIKTSDTKEKAYRVVEKKLHRVPIPNETKKDELDPGITYKTCCAEKDKTGCQKKIESFWSFWKK